MSHSINLALALDPNQELSLDDLDLVLGGGANNVSAAGAGDDKPQEQYGPPPPPPPSDSGTAPPGFGGFPPGAPGLVQPGNNAGEAFSDAAAYAAQHAAAEILDIGAAYAPFPANYILDKASDFVRPSESSYQEYAEKH